MTRLTLLAMCVISTCLSARAQVSLATVVDLAQHNSTEVRLAQADLVKAQAALAQTLDAYIPNFMIGSNVGYSHGFPTGQPSVGSATMQSLVFSYAQRQYIRAARAGVDAANAKVKDAREEVALDASTAYIEFDTVSRELGAVRQQSELAARLVEIEQQRTDAGVDPMSELLQAKLTAATLKLTQLHLESRAQTAAKRIAVLTGLPVGSILPDRASIPEIPAVTAEETRGTAGIDAANLMAQSKHYQAKGDDLAWRRPLIGFGAVYNYDSNELNSYSTYYLNFTPNNVSFGLQINLPFFDFALRAKAKGAAADALRARVEAEQAQRQNEVAITELNGTLRELEAQAEVASLKQQIVAEQLKTVQAQLDSGNGSGAGPQLSPKAEQLARIDERQKYADSIETQFNLDKARLGLLRALGHMQDWLNELHVK